jgi:hypothetical protein
VSVLKNKRTTSKAEFVNTANEIYTETINFLSRLSARHSRLLAEPTIKMAAELVSYTEKAQSYFTSNDIRLDLRERDLLQARGALMALDVQLCHCYMVMMKNPQGCFTDAKGNKVPKKEAEERLETMAQILGELIDTEDDLIKGTMQSDAELRRRRRKNK